MQNNTVEIEEEREREMPSVAVLVLIPTTVLFLICSLSLRRNRKGRVTHKLPPGSMGIPFIGETFSLIKPHSLTTAGEFMEQRIARFGKIFSTNLMGSPTIVSADAELNRLVLKNEMRLFGPNRSPTFERVLGRESITLAVGDAHKHLRSSVLEFLSGERLRTLFLQDADCLASLLISSWKEGSTISARDEATKKKCRSFPYILWRKRYQA